MSGARFLVPVAIISASPVAAQAQLNEPTATGAVANGSDSRADIIVTARLREEAARDVPFALTVLDAEALETGRIDDAQSFYRQVPGLALTTFDDGRYGYFQLRGIGPLSQAISPDDGSVITYVDGVPQPVYASEFSYLDLERIEVLRGPQGTLFGRNSQGGAINVTTRQPGNEFRYHARAEAGEDRYILGQASASGPIVADRLAVGVTARISTFDGYVTNLPPVGGKLGDRDVYAGRVNIVWTPTGPGGVRFGLSGNVDKQVSQPFFYTNVTLPRPTVQVNPGIDTTRTASGLSLRADIPLGFADLTSVTAFNGYDYSLFSDDTEGLIYGPLFGTSPETFLPPLSFSDWAEREKRFYQELRLGSQAGQAVAWAAGLTYFRSRFEGDYVNRSTISPFQNGRRDFVQKVDSYAAFGEVTVPFGSPRLKATLGGRYTRDDKSLEALFTGNGFPNTVAQFTQSSRASFDLWTGRASLAWEASDNLNVYATVGRGAKSGGFPRFSLTAAIGQPASVYAKSTSWTYEAGLKARLGTRGRLELSGFYNDVADEQLFVLDFVSFQFVPVNIDTRSYGIELQGTYELTDGLNLSGGIAWTNAKIQELEARSGARPGNRVPNVARFSSTAALDYVGTPIFGNAVPIVSLSHQYIGPRSADVAESLRLPGYHNVDARVGLRFGRLEAYAFARNLFDTRQILNGLTYGPGAQGWMPGRGRVAGIGASANF
ncbi:MAG: TonB-dependent receptor [Sphingorhabdus sp.]